MDLLWEINFYSILAVLSSTLSFFCYGKKNYSSFKFRQEDLQNKGPDYLKLLSNLPEKHLYYYIEDFDFCFVIYWPFQGYECWLPAVSFHLYGTLSILVFVLQNFACFYTSFRLGHSSLSVVRYWRGKIFRSTSRKGTLLQAVILVPAQVYNQSLLKDHTCSPVP